jgi:MFS family permease
MSPQDPLIPPTNGYSPPHDTNSSGIKYTALQELDPHEPVPRPSVYRRKSFIVQFANTKGPPQIALLLMLVALGLGCTIGVVPAVMTDRFARLNHGYNGDACASFGMHDKPSECLDGSSDAQNTVALSSLISNVLTFTTSSLIGSLSDEHGRRGEFYEDASASASAFSLYLHSTLLRSNPSCRYFSFNSIATLFVGHAIGTNDEPILVLFCGGLDWIGELGGSCTLLSS